MALKERWPRCIVCDHYAIFKQEAYGVVACSKAHLIVALVNLRAIIDKKIEEVINEEKEPDGDDA